MGVGLQVSLWPIFLDPVRQLAYQPIGNRCRSFFAVFFCPSSLSHLINDPYDRIFFVGASEDENVGLLVFNSRWLRLASAGIFK
jgi:hypothetical protein